MEIIAYPPDTNKSQITIDKFRQNGKAIFSDIPIIKSTL